MNETTLVYLTPSDAQAFISFQKHFALIQLLESLDVFSIRNGSCQIHFDSFGKIGAVDIHKHFKA